ncbi:hypothetical protein CBS101457_002349 [Exobasidium rhododendri]|nr:hypothetical protein CBS101457_002349 [Exobasidium rhododendri]
MTKTKIPPRSQPPLLARPPPPQGLPPQPNSPAMDDGGLSAAVAAAKKKKKKGKGKKADDDLDGNITNHHTHLAQSTGNGPFSATAQAQADLLATASDLYRRIEADPQGIPDDDAYWTSLPSHLRTFIRNALPIGQLPTSAQNDVDDPNSRQASTQAMIAVAQQLAQAAHASQRHLQQHPPSGNNTTNNFQHLGNSAAYPPFPFDPSVFADLALQKEQALPLHPHPNSTPNGGGFQYSNHINPPPSLPPGEPLPAPVVLVNEYDDEHGEFDDDYYSDDDMDQHEAATLDSRDENWSHDVNGSHPNGMVAKNPSSTPKKKNKKKKKKGGTEVVSTPVSIPLPAPLPPPTGNTPRPNTIPTTNNTNQAPYSNPPLVTTQQPALPRSIGQPPPSSRAAGKQPMTFNTASVGKSPANARPAAVNGVGQNHNHGPVSNVMGKRPASATASLHEHGSMNGTGAVQSTPRAWSSSSAEERERIKDFWLGLNEKERKNLIKIEKDGVLKKMKEQQKHGCSCAVCGRKRNSIEDELEVLYEAYYDELELYASHQQKYVESGGQLPPPPGPGPFPGSVALDSQGAVIGGNAVTKQTTKRTHQHTHPLPPPSVNRTKTALPPEDDEAYDEDLEDEEYEDDYEYEDEEEEEEELDEPEVKSGVTGMANRRRTTETGAARPATKGSNDLFNFGSSLTVKGGILTVADDLLKNDGQKFLEMMEQLAERRALREEEVQAELDNGSEEEDLDEEEEEEEEEVEEDALTDEQRMEEGRRMFQIFAARMFEQRVLQAYRERVAQERQLQLLRELEEEDMAEKEREAKKAKENQKKKDKKKQAKQQKEEERLKLENEKANEEAAIKAKLEKQREAELKKQEEIRLKRESEKRVKEEEKAKKEEEKRKRQEEERAREMEKERKKKEKDDRIRLERETKEAKERDLKEKEEEERRTKELKLKQDQEKEEKELQDREQAKEEAEKIASQAKKDQLQREAAAAQQQHSSTHSSVPVSPSSSKAQVTKSPSSSLYNNSSSTLNRKVVEATNPSASPLVPQATTARSSVTLPASILSGPVLGSGAARGLGSNRSMNLNSNSSTSSPSTLPAPPQGLPPRPNTNHATIPTALSLPISSTASTTSSSSSSLPRPPISQSAIASNAIASPARQATPSNAASSTLANKAIMLPSQSTSVSTIAPPQQQQQQQQQSVTGMPFSSKSNVPASHSPLPPMGRYPIISFGNGNGIPPSRSPPSATANLNNGFMSGSSSMNNSNKGGIESVLGSPNSVNATTAGMSSLSMAGLPSSTMHTPSQMPIGPIGGGIGSSASSTANSNTLPPHSRSQSTSTGSVLDDYGRHQPMGNGISRPISRPAPGPIGPIGRPRDVSHDDLAHGNMNSSIFGTNVNPLPERILGSSALGGDDELVEPQPRRTSHNTVPIATSSFFGTSTFGAPSPWASSFATSSSGGGNLPRTPSTPVAPSILQGTLGTGLTSPTSATGAANSIGGASGFGSLHQGGLQQGGAPSLQSNLHGSAADPWARAQNSWDRARFAFEQPNTQQGPPAASLQHQHQHQQHQQQPIQQANGGPPLNPFGTQSHNQLRGMFGVPGGNSNSSPHRHANDRGL